MRETAQRIEAITNPIMLLRLEKPASNETHPDTLSVLHNRNREFISMKALTKSGNLPTC